VTFLEDGEQALELYRKRMKIEEQFRDPVYRGKMKASQLRAGGQILYPEPYHEGYSVYTRNYGHGLSRGILFLCRLRMKIRDEES